MDQFSEKTRLGLRARLFAAGLFAAAACVPVIFFVSILARSNERPELETTMRALVMFGSLPISIAAFFGFTLGSRILDPERPSDCARAIMRGVMIGALSYVVFAFAQVFLIVILSDGQAGMWSWQLALVVYGVGAFIVGWLILISGGAGGYVLHRAAGNDAFRGRLEGSPRVDQTTTYRWHLTAVIILFAVNAFLWFMPSLMLVTQRAFFKLLDQFD